MTTIIGGTTGIAPAQWATAGRPSSPLNGQLGWNTTIGGLETWNGSAWGSVTGAPAFSVFRNSNFGTIASGTTFVVPFNQAEFDTTTAFNTSTYRFTPQVAGYYQVNAQVNMISAGGSVTRIITFINKNGTVYKYGNDVSATINSRAIVSSVVFLNGSTDYLTVSSYIEGTGSLSLGGTTSGYDSYFNGVMVRGA